MKKLSIAVAALAWAGLAQAGEYHRMGQLRCTDCHTMHASRAHTMQQDNGGVTGIGTGMNAATATPNQWLLVSTGVNDTCNACHDGQPFAPDVVGATNSGNVPAGTRSAGFLNEDGDGNENFGHTLHSTATPPGFDNAWTWAVPDGFECEGCHAVHGSRAYRNAGLGRAGTTTGAPSSGAASFANVGATYAFVAAPGDVNTDVDVSIAVGTVGPALSLLNGTIAAANSFETADITFGKGAGNATNALFTGQGMAGVTTPKVLAPNGMNTYCAKCHGNFHGDLNTRTEAGTGTDFLRHPTSGVVRTDTTFTGAFTGVAGTDPTVVLNSAQGSVVRAVFTDAAKGSWEVGCLTCHKAHGNGRVFGLIFPDHTDAVTDFENGDAAALPDGDYPIRNLCITCHGMGRSY